MAKTANTKKNAIDEVTTERLDMVLKLSNIQLHVSLIDKIIDAVELIEQKGGGVRLDDVTDMHLKWRAYGHEVTAE